VTEPKEKAADKAAAKEEEAPDLTIAEKAEVAAGEELAEKYVEEQEARADDDPLVIAQAERAEADEAAAAADEERAKAAEAEDE
jgi:hypothetical protein